MSYWDNKGVIMKGSVQWSAEQEMNSAFSRIQWWGADLVFSDDGADLVFYTSFNII